MFTWADLDRARVTGTAEVNSVLYLSEGLPRPYAGGAKGNLTLQVRTLCLREVQ